MGWFKALTGLFRADPAGKALYAQLQKMLAIGGQMFDLATAPLFDADAVAPDREEIYRMDQDLNRLEREVRQRLLTSVAVNPEQDDAMRMRLMELVRHAERCGDFSKNIFEVFENSGALPASDFRDALAEQRTFISGLFERAWTTYDAGDSAAAEEIVARARELSRKDNEIVAALLTGSECEHAVAVAMMARFLKRIQSHLVNIARTGA